jgi:DNA-directed RNA polymerase alpha subunit
MKNLSSNTASQQQRILTYLKQNQHGATTLEMVKELDVLRPGARICELRQQGIEIVTHWVIEHTHLGIHKNARYVLISPTN